MGHVPTAFESLLTTSRSPRLRAMAERFVARTRIAEATREVLCGNQPWGPPPPSNVFQGGPILLGHSLDGMPVRLHFADVHGPLTLIVGLPASGKTVLMHRVMTEVARRGVLVVGVDTKGTPHETPLHPLPMLTPPECALDLRAPDHTRQDAYLARILVLIEKALYVHSGSLHMLDIARKALEKGECCCFASILRELEQRLQIAKPWSKSSGHLESAVHASARLTTGTPLFSGAPGLSWQRRFGNSHVLMLREQSAEAIRVCALTYLEAFLQHAATKQWSSRELRALFCLDDARVIARHVHREGQAAGDPLIAFTDVAHASGGSLVVAVQHLAEVSSDVLAACNMLVLVGPVSAEDVRHLRTRLQLNPQREDWLLHQPPFQAVLHIRRHAWSAPFPVVLAGPEHSMPPETATPLRAKLRSEMFAGAEVRLWQADAAETTTTAHTKSRREKDRENTSASQTHSGSSNKTPAQTASAARAPHNGSAASAATQTNSGSSSDHTRSDASNQALPAEQHRLLCAIADTPWLVQSELGERCGVQGRELTALREQLRQSGAICVHQLHRYVLWELQEVGSRRIGRVHTPLVGRGSFPHRFAQHRWSAWMRQGGARAWVEHQVPDVGPMDGWATFPDGSVHAAEFVLAEETLARAIEKLSNVQGHRLLVVLDAPARKRAHDGLCDLRAIAVQTVPEFIKCSQHGHNLA